MPALRRGTCFSLEPVSQVTRWQRDCARRNRYAARRPRARCNVNMTGFTTNRRERVLCCRYPGGRNRHTRFPVVLALRRGARRLDLITPSSEGTDSLTYRPEGRRPRSCRRTPRVSPLVLVGATLGFYHPTARPGRARFRPSGRAPRSAIPKRPALRTSCRVSSLPAHVRILPRPQSARRPWVASHRFLGRAGWFHRLV